MAVFAGTRMGTAGSAGSYVIPYGGRVRTLVLVFLPVLGFAVLWTFLQQTAVLLMLCFMTQILLVGIRSDACAAGYLCSLLV